MADGSIRIDTKINKKGAEQGLNELKKSADEKVRQLEKGVEKASKEVDTLNNKFSETSQELANVEAQMDSVANGIAEMYKDFENKMSVDDWDTFITGQIEADSQYQKLKNKQTELVNKVDMYSQKIREAKSNQEQMNSSLGIAKQEQADVARKLDDSKKELEENQKKAKKLADNLKKAKKESNGLKTANLGISDSIGKGVKSLLKYGLALLGIRSIYQGLKSSANAWLNSGAEGTKQLKADIDSITVAIGSGLQPVIQTIYNIVIKLLGVVASLIKAFTGVNIFANATKKNLTAATGSAKKLKNELSNVGFDEQEKLQDTSDSGSGGGGDLSPSIDYTTLADQFTELAEKIKGILEKIFDPFKKAWETTGQEVIDAWYNALDGMKALIKAVGKSFEEIWTNGTVQKTAELLLKIVADILNIIGNIARAFANAWNEAGNGTAIIQALANAFNNVLAIVESILRTFAEWWKTDKAQAMANAIIEIFKILSGWIENLTANLKKIWDNGGKHAFTSLLDACSNIIQIFKEVLKAIDPLVKGIENLLGNALAGLFDMIGNIIDGFNSMFDAITSVDGGLEALTIVISGIAIAIGVYWVQQNLATIALGAWNTITAIATAVTGAFSAVMAFLTSPITLVILAITALIAIIVLLVNNWDTVSAALSEGWEWLKEKAIEIFTAIGEFFSNIWESIKETAISIWNAIKDFFSNLWNSITETIKNIWNAIVEFFKNIFENIKNLVTTVFDNIKNTITTVLNAIKTIWDTIWNTIKTITSTVWNAIYNTISSIFNNIKNTVSNVFNAIKTTITNIWNGIKSTITNIVNGICSGVSNAFNNLKNSVTNVFNAIRNAVSNVWNSIWNNIRNVANSILGGIERMVNGIINGLNGMIGAINRLHFDIPDWVPGLGGKTLGFNISTIGSVSLPRLAKGGIAMQPTQAVIGEAGKEAILPLENNNDWMETMAEIFAERIREILEELGFGDDDDIPINIFLDSEVIQRLLTKRNKKKNLATNGRC